MEQRVSQSQGDMSTKEQEMMSQHESAVEKLKEEHKQAIGKDSTPMLEEG